MIKNTDMWDKTRPQGIKQFFSTCTLIKNRIMMICFGTQLSMKFVLLINLKLLTVANSFLLTIAEHENFSVNMKMPAIAGIFILISRENFMLDWVEYEKSFINSGPGKVKKTCSVDESYIVVIMRYFLFNWVSWAKGSGWAFWTYVKSQQSDNIFKKSI